MIGTVGLVSRRVGLCLVILSAVAGCGGSSSSPTDAAATGGKDAGSSTGGKGTGGMTGTGGFTGTGGMIATGGASQTGGSTVTGGAGGTATGGVTTGGAGGTATGGAGGMRTGGAGGTATGGAGGTATGGAGGTATGGVTTGGAGGTATGGAGGGMACATAATCPAPAGGNGMAACTGGFCTVTCNTGYHRCGNVCALNTSPLTCGTTASTAACTPCAVPANGTATCDPAGGGTFACGINCTNGYHECPGAGAAPNTCVVNGSTSIASCGNNCTVCVAPANGTVMCGGTPLGCVRACNAGYHLCGTTCVIDNSPSVTSCGNMCTVCNDPANGSPNCGGGPPLTCGLTCDAGYHACPTVNPTMCVANNNVNSCGTSCTPCAARANATVACVAGTCTYTCGAGRHMCSNVCVLDDADATCGTVDNVSCIPCATGTTCNGASVCEMSMCAAGTHRCGDLITGTCQPNTSITLCGTGNGVCVACPVNPPANAHAVCAAGVCGTACDTNFCRKTTNGTCLSNILATSCGATCATCPGPTGATPHGVASCTTTTAGPACDITCDAGYHLCGTLCVTNSDPLHCGSACTTCSAPLPTDATGYTCEIITPPTTYGCSFACAAGTSDPRTGTHRCGNACVDNAVYCVNSVTASCTACTGGQICNVGATACTNPPPPPDAGTGG